MVDFWSKDPVTPKKFWESDPVNNPPMPTGPVPGTEIAIPDPMQVGEKPADTDSADWKRGMFAPVERNEKTGELRLAWPELALLAGDMLKFSGDAAKGKYPELMPGHSMEELSPEVIGRALNFAGFAAGIGGSIPLKVAKMAVGKAPISKFAQREIRRALDADNAFGGPGAENIAAAGKNGMLADAGPNTTALLDTAAQHSGKGGTVAKQAIELRAAETGDNVQSVLDTVLGVPEGRRALTKEIRDSTAAARKTTYDAAYEKPIDYASDTGRTIEDLLKRVPKEAIAEANAMMRAEGVGSKHIMATIADDGSVTFRTMPDVRQLDYIKRGLDQVVQATEDKGAMGGVTAKGRIYQNLARELRTATAEAVPEYRVALDTAADPISRVAAVKIGDGLLSTKMSREEAAEAIAGMSVAEKDAAKQGLRSRIDEIVANVRQIVSDPNLDARQAREMFASLSSEAAREKVRLLVGDDAGAIFQAIDEAGQSLGLRAAVAKNSATFARTSLDAAIKERVDGGSVGQLAEGKPVAAAQRMVQGVTRRTPAAMRGKREKLYAEIADALVSKRGEQALTLLRQLDPDEQRMLLSNSPLLRQVALGPVRDPKATAEAIDNFVGLIAPGR
jgi:hypothetical protein